MSEAAAIERQIWDHGDVLAAAEKERETLTANDDFESHGLEDEGLRCWLDLLSAHPEIQAAYLRRKRLQFLRDDPRFVLAVRVKVPWYRRTEPISNRIMQALIKEFPAAGWVVILNSSDKSFRAKLEAAADRIS